MDYFVISLTALGASMLTFFSGFGLGTLLTPVFAIFFPIELALAMTAIVHFLNGLFKLALVGRHAVPTILLKFGLPAIVFAIIGAWLLVRVSDLPAVFSYAIAGRTFYVLPVKLVIALLMIVFASFEIVPRLRDLEFDGRYLPLGGVVSGFFGGLSGHQGALRSAFLARAGLTKKQFIGTGVAIATLIDIGRVTVYAGHFAKEGLRTNALLIATATFMAFLGAYIGNKLLKKITMNAIQGVVAMTLFLLAIALGAGFI